MASPHIEYAVLPAGDGPGQDRCLTADGLVVVLDGASAYDPSVSPDAGVYVDTLGSALVDEITSRPHVDLREALAEAIRDSARKLALVPQKAPSSTVSIVRWSDESVDVLVLGDSPVVVHLGDGRTEVVVQHPMDHIAPELRRLYRERLACGLGYDHEHRQLLARIQEREASQRNRLGGYWIAEAAPQAASHAENRTYRSDAVDACVALTDGAQNGLTLLGLELVEIAKTRDDLLRLLQRAHQAEATKDPNGRVVPRSKVHDDKALAVLAAGVSWRAPDDGSQA